MTRKDPVRRVRSRPTLTRQQSFALTAAVAAIALWTSAAPSLTYPLYESQWGLTAAVTTAIFAIYPIVLVVMLILFGNVSDYIGFRTTILLGLTASLVGVVLFAVAPNVWWVFIGRGLMGVGVALSLSPATAAAIEFSPPGRSGLARSITTAATAVGYGLAVLVGGALVQYAPFPLHLNFWVLSVVIAVVIAFAIFLPTGSEPELRKKWRPTGFTFPRGHRRFVIVGTAAITSAYTMAVVMISLGAQIAGELVGSTNELVNGGVIGLNALAIGVTAIVSRSLKPRTSVFLGAIGSLAGLLSIVGASTVQSLPLLLVAAVILGAGYSLLFSGGLGVVGLSTLTTKRAGMLSAAYLVAYLGQGTTALSIGAIATSQNLTVALVEGSVAIGLLSVITAVLAFVLLPARTFMDQPRAEAPLGSKE